MKTKRFNLKGETSEHSHARQPQLEVCFEPWMSAPITQVLARQIQYTIYVENMNSSKQSA